MSRLYFIYENKYTSLPTHTKVDVDTTGVFELDVLRKRSVVNPSLGIEVGVRVVPTQAAANSDEELLRLVTGVSCFLTIHSVDSQDGLTNVVDELLSLRVRGADGIDVAVGTVLHVSVLIHIVE